MPSKAKKTMKAHSDKKEDMSLIKNKVKKGCLK